MGSGASRESSGEASTQITGTSTVRSLPGTRTRSSVAKEHEKSAHPAKNAPVKRATKEHIDTAMMSDSKIKKNRDNLAEESENELIPSAKSSSDFDDDAFDKFCGEIDRVLEGHGPAVEEATSQRRKSPVSSSVVRDRETGTLLPELPTCARGSEGEFPDGRRPSVPGQPRGSFQFEQQVHNRCTTSENQLQHQQPPPRHQQHQLSHQQHQHAYLQQHQYDQQQHAHRPMPTMSAPPPLALRGLEKPMSLWKRPEDLAHREQLLRDRHQDTWLRSEAESASNPSGASLVPGASREGSTMRMRQNSDLVPFQEERRQSRWEDAPSQEKEGFDISKFKAANKKQTNSHKVDKLLPTTYRGYNASLSRQGTLPSLHRGSLSSTLSSSGTPASDKHGSSPCDDGKELKYDPSEEALLDFIEKEFS